MVKDFGMTCPLLKISQAFNEDYRSCLMIADYLINDRRPVGGMHPVGRDAQEAILAHSIAFRELRAGLAP